MHRLFHLAVFEPLGYIFDYAFDHSLEIAEIGSQHNSFIVRQPKMHSFRGEEIYRPLSL